MSWRARLSHVFEELRIVYSTKHPESSGVRNFIAANYDELKLLNPGLPFYVRCCDGIKPHVSTRMSNGFYETSLVAGLDVQGIERTLQRLVQKGEEQTKRPLLGSKACQTVQFANII
ncbi:NADH dehydrogenase [ubiquinone] 1 alpha subcomplex subunit 2 [Galdieria sulphuraria]|uniref:NADH dehydrogenase (Ubiquinone) 1 alpha subcomplex 2 n=1 Tax=Galdieria sulphuraria TaxID=130081 RepID=M2XQ07_GALSU|nr:NADH dehydrogenase (ubiquinone) 1 alpha subcomplex 2 [Galdieria sulphuraria]EME32302.1 NADH dehydrogenase (ubiquinone) 1 alpha subcomplex 2 [Galdieria sulphuraria]GJD07142.1 NADH dehydrogenase [ubiquinone] 1 alpha subcomplex subunit 2 [Galdieria sulphuraria]|eukprot:XP_005708822.1 NADH dehydrogenase (ubiquinone) 1 alpha subcomplex 2 [Galdieria sulphuraria]